MVELFQTDCIRMEKINWCEVDSKFLGIENELAEKSIGKFNSNSLQISQPQRSNYPNVDSRNKMVRKGHGFECTSQLLFNRHVVSDRS